MPSRDDAQKPCKGHPLGTIRSNDRLAGHSMRAGNHAKAEVKTKFKKEKREQMPGITEQFVTCSRVVGPVNVYGLLGFCSAFIVSVPVVEKIFERTARANASRTQERKANVSLEGRTAQRFRRERSTSVFQNECSWLWQLWHIC